MSGFCTDVAATGVREIGRIPWCAIRRGGDGDV
jgi:hypothetical protein